ncbi:hypothetical protein AB4Y45_32410 [Paraburkholderia sp. EG287A]|uniref:hypothetical protein n=1 Tax=Paraburkholderia sp. EG287A TaxID=3237012 RepID=UPI0034D21C56
MNGYVGFYRGRRGECEAETSLKAQEILARQFKAKKQHEVTVVLAEKNGEQVVHAPLF